MNLLAVVSEDAIFTAIVTVGLALFVASIKIMIDINTLKEGRKNTAGDIKDIQEKLQNFAQLQGRVEDLWRDRSAQWEFLRERGDVEAQIKKLGKRNSPLSITGLPEEEKVKCVFAPFTEDLKKIEQDTGLDADNESDEQSLWREVAIRLGSQLAEKVCPVLGTFSGACVSLALAYLRQEKHKAEPPCFLKQAIMAL